MSLASGPGRAGLQNHAGLEDDSSQFLAVDQHVAYIQSLDRRKDELEYWLTEHLRLNGVYWGVTALHLLKSPDGLSRQETIDFVLSCQHTSGGFGAAPGHDEHMLYTVSAIQLLALIDALEELETRGQPGGKLRVGQWIASLQHPETGAFAGDEWGEYDTRFLYGAFNALQLLGLFPKASELGAPGQLEEVVAPASSRQAPLINAPKAIEYAAACANFDGGYGICPGAESHAGQIFVCVAALAIAKRLDLVDRDRLGAWLSERQLPCGGLNGRPEKLEDVCYSWWVLSALAIIGRLHWIDSSRLTQFILQCQDQEHGGIADRPGDMVDVFHTFFGLAGLSLLGHPKLDTINAIYALPERVVQRLGL